MPKCRGRTSSSLSDHECSLRFSYYYHILSKAAGKVNDDKLPRGVVERATLLDVYWGHLKGFQKPLHSDNNPFHHYLAKVKNVADARQHSSIL